MVSASDFLSEDEGSTPSWVTINWGVAQLVVQVVLSHKVIGSSPFSPSKYNIMNHKEKAEHIRKSFNEMIEGVDYKMENQNMNTPCEVFKMIPITNKAKNFLKGKY